MVSETVESPKTIKVHGGRNISFPGRRKLVILFEVVNGRPSIPSKDGEGKASFDGDVEYDAFEI